MDHLCHIWPGTAQISLSIIDRFLKRLFDHVAYSTLFYFFQQVWVYMPIATLSLFPCQILRSAPFFCQTISDNYSYITPCYDRIELPTLHPYSMHKLWAEYFSSRSATWWSRLLLGCFPEYGKLNFPLCLESSVL